MHIGRAQVSLIKRKKNSVWWKKPNFANMYKQIKYEQKLRLDEVIPKVGNRQGQPQRRREAVTQDTC